MTARDPYTSARVELQRVPAHVLGRARSDADGRFGRRVTPRLRNRAIRPGRVRTPDCRGTLIREFREAETYRSATVGRDGRSLHEPGASVGVDLAPPFSVGGDTTDQGDVDTPVSLDVDAT